jgi:hypothetical protein
LSFIEQGVDMKLLKAIQIDKLVIIRLPDSSAGKVIATIDLARGATLEQIREEGCKGFVDSAAFVHNRYNKILTSGIFDDKEEGDVQSK